MFYRIGLDIGIASVGWCVMMTDEFGEPTKIVNLGARVFAVAENPKTGASLAQPRREARGLRRRIARKTLRLSEIRALFANNNVLFNNDITNVNELRAQALDTKISEQEFARVLYLVAKHRGFKSNKKADKKSDEGKLLKATSANTLLMEEKGYRTVGEMLIKEYAKEGNNGKIYETRNKQGDYSKTVLRSELEKEIKTLFAMQNKFGNKLATEQAEKDFLTLFNNQRNFDEGPGKGSKYSANYSVGNCTFEKEEKRAPKASLTAELFTALQKLNNLKIENDFGSELLTSEQRNIILKLMEKQKEIKFSCVRKKLNLGVTDRFNLLNYSLKKDIEKTEDTVFITLKNSKEINEILLKDKDNANVVDEIAWVLTNAKTDDKRKVLFSENAILKNLTQEEINKLLTLDFSKFSNLSLVAMRKILPFLQQGERYDNACKLAGYNHSEKATCEKRKFLKGKDIVDSVNEITSPVVKRAISQTLKVVNAIILEYGSPVAINVELARELSKSKKDRDIIKKQNENSFEKNEKLKKEFAEKFGREPKAFDLLKYKLYEEQKGVCAYSGNPIEQTSRLFEVGYVQVDHIIPYSRSFNDSFNNKVLVLASENQNKGNCTPFEYYKNDADWQSFVARVYAMYPNNYKKKQNLLKEKINEDEMKERALNDTRYICRFVLNLFQEYLLFNDSKVGKKKVIAVNGAVTSYVRKFWGVSKVREDGDLHHAVDATIISVVTNKMIQQISLFNKLKELAYAGRSIVDSDGEIFDVKELENKFKDRLPMPYPTFVAELQARCLQDNATMQANLMPLGYTKEDLLNIKPIFVSKMPNRKGTGSIHKETLASAKYIDDGFTTAKVALSELKLIKKNDSYEIENYFKPQDDIKLYQVLLGRLIDYDGDAKKAFEHPVYKPCDDGKIANIVKKVKIKNIFNSGVVLGKSNSVADNGGMVRVDVFEKNKKFYFIPVYIIDIYKKELSNLAVIIGKKKKDWLLVDETFNFKFSMYHDDLIYVKSKKGIKLTKTIENENSKLEKTILLKEGATPPYVYFKNFGISNAQATVTDNTNCYSAGIGLTTVDDIMKFEVDVLGNIVEIKNGKRQL